MIEYMTTNVMLYTWLLLLTGITVGQFVFTYIIITAWSELPKQKDGKVI
jgi:hypothetical protein